jgi:MoaA/NifB/PqqE/SkfB family radical SAM enzyme
MNSAADTGSAPILQLHLTRHCNLTCRHCYSTSGPRAKVRLELPEGFYDDAFASGYRVVSISGGEPYLDPRLPDQVARARAAGLRVNLVSNGTLIDEAWAQWTAQNIDLVAVSIDGDPDRHDFLRSREGAFDLAMAGLRQLRRAGAAVGMIHTVTRQSLAQMRWLIERALVEGIALVQLHPIEEVGRAATELAGQASDDLPSRLAYLARLLAPSSDLRIQVDVLPRESVERLAGERPDQSSLAHFLNPLVVEPDGRIVPWTFGMPGELCVGSVNDGPFAELLDRYATNGVKAARQYERQVADRVLTQTEWPFVNWYAELTRHQHRSRQAAV